MVVFCDRNCLRHLVLLYLVINIDKKSHWCNTARIQKLWELVRNVYMDCVYGFLKLDNLNRILFLRQWLTGILEGDVFYSSIGQQSVAQLMTQLSLLPWGHNILIFSKSIVLNEAKFYISQTLENNWSRDVLALQVKSNLYKRKGRSITSFKHTLPDVYSDLAIQTLKDPYVFDFVALTTEAKERDIEKQLVTHITKFMLELGKGFAFVGQQYHLEIAGEDYYLDLLFYNIPLKSYVVIELKNTKFVPEYAGKLNFYLSAVDDLLKKEDDKPTLGMLLCRDKNNIGVEYALRDINKPIGVSEFQFTEILPDT